MSDTQEEGFTLQIRFSDPDDIISRYANNLLIQHGEHEFILFFYEVRPPLLYGTRDDIRKQAETLEYIKSECVARIIVPPDRMPDFIKALQENYEKYKSHTGDEGITS